MLSAASLDLEVFSPDSVGGMPDVVEDQDTFRGNALKKAEALVELIPADAVALADDSGLCVDALGGAPSVYSARYAGENATDSDNIDKLLVALDSVEEVNRRASFQCHLAVVFPSGKEIVFEGACSGRIIHERRGEHGFGYDPVFVPDGFERSFAELSNTEKAAISHRGNAMQQLVQWLVE